MFGDRGEGWAEKMKPTQTKREEKRASQYRKKGLFAMSLLFCSGKF